MQDDQDDTLYKVVINDEEQYSLLVADGLNPVGWRDAGKHGPGRNALVTSKKSGPI